MKHFLQRSGADVNDDIGYYNQQPGQGAGAQGA